jgi:ketosteroid isomerase-like protein
MPVLRGSGWMGGCCMVGAGAEKALPPLRCLLCHTDLRRSVDNMSEARAMAPEDVTRLVVERLNAGDATGVAALYEPQAILAYPADRPTTGRDSIRAVYQRMVDAGVRFGSETPLPTVQFEDLALTSTRSADNTGVRVQVLRRQPDGSWLRIIDRPEVPQP